MDSINSENTHEGIGGEIFGYVERYGWFIVGGLALMYYVWNRYRNEINNRLNSIRTVTNAALKKKNDDIDHSDKNAKIEEQIRIARQKLQEKHAEEALTRKTKKSEAERMKKLKEIEKHEQMKKGLSVREDNDLTLEDLGLSTKTEKPTKNTSDEYNPLMGDIGRSRMKFRAAPK